MNRVDNPTVVLRFTVLTLGWRAQRVATGRTRTGGRSGGGASYFLISLPSSSHLVTDTNSPYL